MNPSLNDELLDRYLADEVTLAERGAVEAWIAQRPERASILEAARAALGSDSPAFDAGQAWAALQSRLTEPPTRVRRMEPGRRSTRAAAWRVAALLAGLLLGGALVWRVILDRPAGAVFETRRFSTFAGQRDTVALPDGSTVILAPASTLEIDAAFARGTRDVRLDGEAFFSVAHDASVPFRITAGESRVVVLGTRFGVRTRPSGVVVAVEEGRVSFGPASASDAAVTLTAGRVGRLATGATRPVVGAGSTAMLAWLDGVLEFDDAPLRDVAAEIERWFAVRVRIDDEATAIRRVAGRFNATSANDVLDALSLALGLTVERTDSAIVIRPAGPR